MHSGLFTVAAADNIDYNPSAATAKDSFHCTGISLMQHPFHEFDGNNRGVLVINQLLLVKQLLLSLRSTLVCYQLLSKPKNSKCPLSCATFQFCAVSEAKKKSGNGLKQ